MGETRFLPQNMYHCVSAEYKKLKEKTFWGYSIEVHHYATMNDGTMRDTLKFLYGYIDSDETDAKLSFGPWFLPRFSGYTAGPYWVLAYNKDREYALVSGGPPTIKTETGCTTGSGMIGAGLWILTRAQERNQDLIDEARRIATEKG